LGLISERADTDLRSTGVIEVAFTASPGWPSRNRRARCWGDPGATTTPAAAGTDRPAAIAWPAAGTADEAPHHHRVRGRTGRAGPRVFVGKSPAPVWATLLDERGHLCSRPTMYRILREVGEVRERRRQANHPPRIRSELVATTPGQVRSWDLHIAARSTTAPPRRSRRCPPTSWPAPARPSPTGSDAATATRTPRSGLDQQARAGTSRTTEEL